MQHLLPKSKPRVIIQSGWHGNQVPSTRSLKCPTASLIPRPTAHVLTRHVSLCIDSAAIFRIYRIHDFIPDAGFLPDSIPDLDFGFRISFQFSNKALMDIPNRLYNMRINLIKIKLRTLV